MTERAPAVDLPDASGRLVEYRLGPASTFAAPQNPIRSRVAFAAAHVVADPLRSSATDPTAVDWEATLAYRRHLWRHGLGVAEAMDTAQRGGGLDYERVRELIARSAQEAASHGGALVCGAATDQIGAEEAPSLSRIIDAYVEQCADIEEQGARAVVMASRHLAAVAAGPEDYRYVYEEVLKGVSEPVIIHWLGPMFDPALQGYWGSVDLDAAQEACLEVLADNRAKIDGIKLSLLDAEREKRMRSALPEGVRMYTGDDFNYPELILGDEQRHSHALLGIFDAIAPAASTALTALDAGDVERYRSVLAPTVTLARHIFKTPTYAYKAGVVFLAYLNGHQEHFRMLAGAESARSVLHLVELFKLADEAGLLTDPEEAASRMASFLRLAGVA